MSDYDLGYCAGHGFIFKQLAYETAVEMKNVLDVYTIRIWFLI
jgi:hypothetical protein